MAPRHNGDEDEDERANVSTAGAVIENAIEQAPTPSTNALEMSYTEFTLLNILRWSRASMQKLAEAEQRLFSKVKSHIQSRFIRVRLANSHVYTVTVKPTADAEEHPVPYVFVHGFGAGLAVWAANLDELASRRTVHAFDLLGFAHSSRPDFSADATLAELEFVQSMEDWRRAMNIERMILVGHSLGGFLASAYALAHPQRVRHLVLVDPWGFPDKPTIEQPHIPGWMRMFSAVLSRFNPLASLRLAGPFGVPLIRKLRSDLGVRYAMEDPEAIYDYVYQCNAFRPTGEMAFMTMTKSFGWAKRPMATRFCNMDAKLPATFICGSKSWIDSTVIYDIQSRRTDSYVDVQVITGAGHHVYADAPEAFNALLRSISDIVNENEDREALPVASSSRHASLTSAYGSGRLARFGRERGASISLGAAAAADAASAAVECGVADCSRGAACVSSALPPTLASGGSSAKSSAA